MFLLTNRKNNLGLKNAMQILFFVFVFSFAFFSFSADFVVANDASSGVCQGIEMPTQTTTALGEYKACDTGYTGSMWCQTQVQRCTEAVSYSCTPTGWSIEWGSCVIEDLEGPCDTSSCKLDNGERGHYGEPLIINTPPTVNILGDNPMYLVVGSTFEDPGTSVFDNEDNNMSFNVVVSGSVDTNTVGTYILSYTATDSGGLSHTAHRTVYVVLDDSDPVDPTDPVDPVDPIDPVDPGGNGNRNNYCADGYNLTIQEFVSARDSGAISYSLVVDEVTNKATFNLNNNTGCNAPISLSSYEMHGTGALSEQLFFAGSGLVNAGNNASLEISIPACSTQIDAWFGEYPTILSDDNPYEYPNVPHVLEYSVINRINCGLPTLPTINFTANPENINLGGTTTLTWDAPSAVYCSASWTTSTSTSGTSVLSPATTTTYTISCANDAGVEEQNVTVYVTNPSVNNKPVITLIGNNPININTGDTFVDPGATANDVEDGDLTHIISVSGEVDTATVGSYKLIYSVTDSGNLTATTSRTVNVLNSNNTLYCANGTSLTVTEFKQAVDLGKISYNLSINNNQAVFTINNDTGCLAPISLSSYKMFGNGELSNQELYDGEQLQNVLNSELVVNIPNCAYQVDAWYGQYPTVLLDSNPYTYPNVPYVLSFIVQDNPTCTNGSGGNGGGGTLPTNTAPTITLIGSNPLSMYTGTTFIEPGFVANDIEDGDLTSQVTVSGTVNTNVAGTYTLVYTVTDSGGLSASVSRVVNVTNQSIPNGPTIQKGKIKMCLMIADSNNNISTSSNGLPTGLFSIRLATSTNILSSTIFTKVWNSQTFNPNAKFILGQNDSDCVTIDNLDVVNHIYGELEISGSLWNDALYNDQFTISVNDLEDFYAYGSELGGDNSDGEITLIPSRKDRTLLILVTYNDLPIPPTPTVTLSANPSTITLGNSSTLTWTSTNATQCSAVWTNNTATSGSFVVSPNATTEYVINCTGNGGVAYATTTVTVNNGGGGGPTKPTVTLTANPNTIYVGATSTLTWTSTNATQCSAVWTTSTSTSGSLVVSPATTTYYVINCYGNNATTTATTTVNVNPLPPTPPAPTVTLTANPSTITVGNSSTLTWTSTNATQCSAVWTNNTATSGSFVVNPGSTSTYTIDCFGNNATTTATTTITVNPVTPPGGGGGGGSIGGRRRDISDLLTPQGEILGVTSCMYLRDHLRRDWTNDLVEMLKLKSFLNIFEKENLALDGDFDQATFDAVSRFQNKYFTDVLAPWGHDAPTGFVYITTKKKINEIYCNTIITLTPEQQSEIDAFRNYIINNYGQDIYNTPFGPGVGGALINSNMAGNDLDKVVALETEIEEDSKTATGTTIGTESMLRNIAASVFAFPQRVFEDGKLMISSIIVLVLIVIAIRAWYKSRQIASSTATPVTGTNAPFIILPSKTEEKENKKNEILPDEEIIIESEEETEGEIK